MVPSTEWESKEKLSEPKWHREIETSTGVHVSLQDGVTLKSLFDSVSSRAGAQSVLCWWRKKKALLQFKSDAFLPCFSFKRPLICLFSLFKLHTRETLLLKFKYTQAHIHTYLQTPSGKLLAIFGSFFAALHDVIQKQLVSCVLMTSLGPNHIHST